MRKAVVVIADDEPLARKALRGHLASLDWIGEVHEAGDGLSAIRAVDELRPHILFLDVVMPGVSGVEVAEQIAHRPYIVFTTAFERFAVTAFEIGALDFLLKPFGRDRVRAAAERGRQAIAHGMPSVVARAREALAEARPITRVFVRERGRMVAVPLEEVERLEACDDYVTLHAARPAAPGARAPAGPGGAPGAAALRADPPVARREPRLRLGDRTARRLARHRSAEERRAHRCEPARHGAAEGADLGQTLRVAQTTVLEAAGREVAITNPDKVFFPQRGLHEARPRRSTTSPSPRARCAASRGGRSCSSATSTAPTSEPFFQKRAPEQRPDWVETVELAVPLRPHRAARSSCATPRSSSGS